MDLSDLPCVSSVVLSVLVYCDALAVSSVDIGRVDGDALAVSSVDVGRVDGSKTGVMIKSCINP